MPKLLLEKFPVGSGKKIPKGVELHSSWKDIPIREAILEAEVEILRRRVHELETQLALANGNLEQALLEDR